MSRPEKDSTKSRVEMHQLVFARDVGLHSQCLHSGQLLKWIDIAACLAAERHCDKACVTVSMDSVYFEYAPRVGQVVILKARVSRAFRTSMEVLVRVDCEEMGTARTKHHVCKAYLTFMARSKMKAKTEVPLVIPVEEDKAEYFLAAERRKQRLAFSSSVEKRSRLLLSTDNAASFGRDEHVDDVFRHWKEHGEKPADSMLITDTTVQSIELVLPQHANHHQEVTFGGQLMEWMATACTIAASRVCHCGPVLRSVDSVRFREESRVGDRIYILASVNRSFVDQVEVGCRVEARTVDNNTSRHINTSFFSLTDLSDSMSAADSGAKASTIIAKHLPVVLPDRNSEEEVRRYFQAGARYHIRLEQSILHKSHSGSVEWSQTIADRLVMENYSKITKWRLHSSWHLVNTVNEVNLYKHQAGPDLVLRITMSVPLPAKAVFAVLCDKNSRKKWDTLCKKIEVVEEVSPTDVLLHYVAVANSKTEPHTDQDFVLLLSARPPQDSSDVFTISYQSVKHKKLPEQEGMKRGEMLCSGYVMQPLSSTSCQVTYIHQLSSALVSYFVGDFMGVSSITQRIAANLRTFLIKDFAKSVK